MISSCGGLMRIQDRIGPEVQRPNLEIIPFNNLRYQESPTFGEDLASGQI